MEKIIVKENKQQQDAIINHIIQFILALNKPIAEFKKATFYSLSSDDVLRLMNNHNGAVQVINEKLNLFLDKELDRQKITIPLMRSNFKTGYQDIVSSLSSELRKHIAQPGFNYLYMLTMENNKLVLNKENEEIIRESFRNIINSEAAKKLFDLQNEVAEKLQEFWKFINEKTSLQYFTMAQVTETFFYLDVETKQIEIDTDIDYERIMKK